MPSEDEFPYTVRVVSEILESNGSSSQATICAGCLSLMAAGVPIKAPVAGIAMGLITSKDEKDYTILTDIQGMEDHLGDMDFKVAGTKDGITALQMDIKCKGITFEILKEALAQAKEVRMEILDVMQAQIAEPRKEVSKYAPKTVTFMIIPDKIKEVIGKGGETITKIILEASNVTAVNDINAVKVDLQDDGTVLIYHQDKDIIAKTNQGKVNSTKVTDEDSENPEKVRHQIILYLSIAYAKCLLHNGSRHFMHKAINQRLTRHLQMYRLAISGREIKRTGQKVGKIGTHQDMHCHISISWRCQ